MNNLKKNDEILMTEEEPVPEEYKEQKLSINSNALEQGNNKILLLHYFFNNIILY